MGEAQGLRQLPEKFAKAVDEVERDKQPERKAKEKSAQVEAECKAKEEADQMAKAEAKSKAEAVAKAAEQEEMVRKAHVSDWDHWASLPRLTPREAACLLMELDPDNESDFFKCCNDPRCAGLAEWINKIERVAGRENEGKKLSPAEWIEWARGKGYAVPEKFIKATEAFAQQNPNFGNVDQAQGVAPVVVSDGEPPKKCTAKKLGQITISVIYRRSCQTCSGKKYIL